MVIFLWLPFELDGVGPVDNQPANHQFINTKKNVTCDTHHVTADM